MQPQIRSEQDIYNSLAGVYDPQTQLINQQMSQVETDAAAQQASLEQAKTNAFRDIDLSANRKGMLFSGFSPDQQASYLGTKYLPSVANLKSSVINSKNSLTAQLNKLSADRRSQAIQGVSEDTKAYNAYLKEQNTNAYRQAQLGLGYARLAQSGSNATSKLASQYKVTGKKNALGQTDFSSGYAFTGPNGRPVNMATYVANTGGGVGDVLDLLAQGTKDDRGLYNYIQNNIKTGKISTENDILKAIKNDSKNKYYGF